MIPYVAKALFYCIDILTVFNATKTLSLLKQNNKLLTKTYDI